MLKVQSGVVLFTIIFLCTGFRVKGETQVALLLQNVQTYLPRMLIVSIAWVKSSTSWPVTDNILHIYSEQHHSARIHCVWFHSLCQIPCVDFFLFGAQQVISGRARRGQPASVRCKVLREANLISLVSSCPPVAFWQIPLFGAHPTCELGLWYLRNGQGRRETGVPDIVPDHHTAEMSKQFC